jgi:predicted NBD/HSP70 family sugar kinase
MEGRVNAGSCGGDVRRGTDLRHRNAADVVAMLAARGPIARVDLARRLSLSTGAVTRITSDLVDAGIVRELEPAVAEGAGRRRVPMALDEERFGVIGVHVGLSELTYGLVDLGGRLIGSWQREPVSHLDPVESLERAWDLAAEIAAEHARGRHLIGLGIVAAQVTVSGGRMLVVRPSTGTTPSDVTAMLSRPLPHVGAATVDNAYRAAARAEMWFGGAKDLSSFVYAYIGSALGAAVVVRGALLDSASAPVGRIAHIPVEPPGVVACTCGRSSCLTSVAGSAAMARQAAREGMRGTGDVRVIDELADAGDAIAGRLVARRLDAIGQALATVIDVLSPERVLVSGRSIAAPERLDELREAVGRYSQVDPASHVMPAGLGDYRSGVVVAAASTVLESFYQRPLDPAWAAESAMPAARAR